MSSLDSKLELDLKAAVMFFEELQVAQKTPYVYGFPKNSCEFASAFLASALTEKYNGASVSCVTGKNPKNSQMHFWVEVEDIVIDPTAHQFDQYDQPFISRTPHPLQVDFSELEYSTGLKAIDALKALDAPTKAQILESLLRRVGI